MLQNIHASVIIPSVRIKIRVINRKNKVEIQKNVEKQD